MRMKLIIFIWILMGSTACTNKQIDFNPWTTIVKEVVLNARDD